MFSASSFLNMATQGPNGDFPYIPSGAAEVNRLIQENCELFSESQCKVCNAVLISESQKLAHYQSKKHAAKVRRYMATHEDEPFAKRFKPSSQDAESGEVLQNKGDKYKSCHVCNMSFSSAVVAQSHYQGKVHARNLKVKSVAVQPPAFNPAVPQHVVPAKKQEAQTKYGQGSAVHDPNRFCTICQASFNNPVMAQQHYSGKKHKKHLTKQKLMETFGPSAIPGEGKQKSTRVNISKPSTATSVKGYPCTMCNIELNSVEQYQAHVSGAKHKNHVRLKEGGNSTASPLTKKQPDYACGYYQEQPPQEDWGSLKQDYESGGL